MTLPSDIFFPYDRNRILSGKPEEIESYLRELTVNLEQMYGNLVQNINGLIRADFTTDDWTPILKGTTLAGSFTYSHQHGWVLRRGIIVDVWGDIDWTATTATGNLYVELPYRVAITNQMPFVGTVQSDTFAYTGGTYCVINGISNTYRGEIWNSGTGIASVNQAVTASGRVIFHLRYIGQDDER